jgi:hypothetical protein
MALQAPCPLPVLETKTQYDKKELASKKVFFLHIPKTAGISSLSYLNEILQLPIDFVDLNPKGVRNHFPLSSSDQKLPSLLKSKFLNDPFRKIYWSHIPYYFVKDYSDTVCIFTILRHPLERVLSHRRFFKLQVNVKPEEITHAEESLLQSSQTNNLQTLYLTSLDPYDKSISMKDHLNSAKFNLEHNVYYVGITEDLQVSLDILSERLGAKKFSQVKNINVTKDKTYLNENWDLEKISKDNWADFELYEFALDLYKKRLSDKTRPS